MKDLQSCVDDVSHDERVVALKTRNIAVQATGHHLNRKLRDKVSAKCISGHGTGELLRLGEFLRIVTRERNQMAKLTAPSASKQQHCGASCQTDRDDTLQPSAQVESG